MTTKRILQHMSDSVSSGKLVTLNIPGFHTVYQLGLTFENSGAPATLANIISSVQTITLLVNGEQMVNVSADHIAKVWTSLGTQVGGSLVNSLPILLPGLIYKLPEAEDAAGGIGCDRFTQGAPVSNIQIQIQFGTVTGVDSVRAYSERADLGTGANVTRAVCKLLSYFKGFTTVGTDEYDSLPRDSDMGRLFTLCVADSTGVISKGESYVNNDPIIQNCDIATNQMFCMERGFGAVPGVFNYLYGDGGTFALLSMKDVNDARVKTTFTTANTAGYWLVDATIRSLVG